MNPKDTGIETRRHMVDIHPITITLWMYVNINIVVILLTQYPAQHYFDHN